jgi:hypothetical protein
MSVAHSYLDRFVRSVHRRMVLLRAAERVGVCLLFAAGVSLLIMPVLMYRGRETGAFLWVMAGASLFAGIVWAIVRRPGPLAAAAEADRQLRLADLIGTAWAIRNDGAGDAFAAVVLADAEARCRGASPSALRLHRLGPRGWGGIGVAVALAVALHSLGPDSGQSAARASSSPQPRTWQEMEAERGRAGNDARSVAALDLRRPRGDAGTDDDPTKTDHPDPSAQRGGDSTASKPGADDPANTAQSADGAGGAGSAKSNVKNAGGPAADPTAGGSAKTATGAADTSTGGGGATADTPPGGNASANGGTTAAGGAKSRRPAPVWQSSDWGGDQAAAREAVRSGKVPDAYRDLVREYFERE